MHRPPNPQTALDIARTLENSPYLEAEGQLSGLDLIKKEFANTIKAKEDERNNKELRDMMAEMAKKIGALSIESKPNSDTQHPP